ncbi:hypothetical protein QVD17_37836 [Tagetes erecta]|uniref:EGF-like domain-containing protein n=1 Tax=Tagetes erecta TaxID=13708 RepID=A0AAD8NIS8_TARER|nr:hypothetical protein QVD17_37836 [Tagetes erecta]
MSLHFILCMFFTFYLTRVVEGAITNNTAKPGCLTQCGNITVPYPFGIGIDCSLNLSFNVTCNVSSKPAQLLLADGTVRIYDISDLELRISTVVSYMCYNESGFVAGMYSWTNLQKQKEFTFSEKNRFTVIGCDDYAWVTATLEDDFTGGCFGLCSKTPNVPYGQCSGIGCCQISIPKGLSIYNASLYTLKNHSSVLSFNKCSYGFLVEDGRFKFSGERDLSANYSDFVDTIQSTMPIVVDWVIAPEGNCSVEVDVCKGESSCYDVDGGGYRCKCNNGYDGNPYLDQGCQDIDECHDQETNHCYGICVNTLGSYNCTCELGFTGDARILNGCKRVTKDTINLSTVLIIVIAASGMLALMSGIAGIFFGIRRRKLIKLREKFFEQNGGVLLKQKMKSQRSHEAMTLFTAEQLRKATDNYSQEQVIGKGGYGVVYKELLTGKKAIGVDRTNNEKNLAAYFVSSIKGNRLFEIVEPRLLREATLDQLQSIGNLVKRCLSFIGDDRPTMKEVVVELEGLRKFRTHPWAQQEASSETKSLVLEVDQSDLYDIPLIHEWESSSSITTMAFQENNPR